MDRAFSNARRAAAWFASRPSVRPSWVHEMKKMYKLGVHTFYRPLNWGDGSEEPTWGDAATTKKQAAMEEKIGSVSHSREWLRSEEEQASIRQKSSK